MLLRCQSTIATALISVLLACSRPSLAADGTPGALTLASPTPYTVFQRSAANVAKVAIAGRAGKDVAVIEASVALMAPYQPGIDGKPVEFTPVAKPIESKFSGTLEVPAGGWYELTVRAKDGAGKVVGQSAVQKIGVGEVFIAAGHSFCSAHNGEGPTKAKDDRVATLAQWTPKTDAPPTFRHCDDPLRPADGNHASPWPGTGDILVSKLHVPVLLINTGIGGSTVAEWLKSADHVPPNGRCYPPFQSILQHVAPYTGLRGVVWFGNENDLWGAPTAELFRDQLTKLIAHSRTDAGNANLPWVIAFDAYFPSVASAAGPAEKQKRKEQIDRGTEFVLESVPHTYDGPQTDDLGPQYRKADGDHFNELGLQQLAIRFSRKITQAFFASAVLEPQVSKERTPKQAPLPAK